MKGIEIVDDRVWIVNSNYPIRMPGVPSIAGLSVNNGVKFECTKVIVIVRNPIDAIVDLAKL